MWVKTFSCVFQILHVCTLEWLKKDHLNENHCILLVQINFNYVFCNSTSFTNLSDQFAVSSPHPISMLLMYTHTCAHTRTDTQTLRIENSDLLDKNDDGFTVPEMQDFPATFSKKIIIKLGVYHSSVGTDAINHNNNNHWRFFNSLKSFNKCLIKVDFFHWYPLISDNAHTVSF